MKERREINPHNAFYCKVCRSYYISHTETGKIDHLKDHKEYIDQLIELLDAYQLADDNVAGDLQNV